MALELIVFHIARWSVSNGKRTKFWNNAAVIATRIMEPPHLPPYEFTSLDPSIESDNNIFYGERENERHRIF